MSYSSVTDNSVFRRLSERMERESFKDVERKCTDVCYTLIFCLFTAIAVLLVIAVMSKAQTNYIKYGMDSEGNFCGLSAGYQNYPYVFYNNIEGTNWFPYAVCIASCPGQGFNYNTVSCTGSSNVPAFNGQCTP